jgi:hypothetical protein
MALESNGAGVRVTVVCVYQVQCADDGVRK